MTPGICSRENTTEETVSGGSLLKPGMVTLDEQARPFTTVGLVGPTEASISSDPVRTVTARLTATSTTIPTGPAIAAGNPQSSNSSKRPSTIGIAVGVTGGIIVLVLAALLVVWRRRRRHRHTSKHNDEPGLKSLQLIVNNSHQSQEESPYLSEIGFPPRELYNRDEHMDRKMLAEAPALATSRQELSAGVDIVPELAYAGRRDI
ncbi:MAG: hypothetical protein Q9195_001365 [Heterodermia aff. obscurata]